MRKNIIFNILYCKKYIHTCGRINLNSYLKAYIKLNSKYIKSLKHYNSRNYKSIKNQENSRKTLTFIMAVLDVTIKAEVIKAKLKQLDYTDQILSVST